MKPIDINRKDFYDRKDDERTRKRLQQLIDNNIVDLGNAEFGVKGVFSGLYIEKVWYFKDFEWNNYMNWALGLIEKKRPKNPTIVDRHSIPVEDVLSIVKFVGSKEEFMKKAGEIIADIKSRKERSETEKLIFGNNLVNIYVYGTVKGELVNEIWFVKHKVEVIKVNADTEISEELKNKIKNSENLVIGINIPENGK